MHVNLRRFRDRTGPGALMCIRFSTSRHPDAVTGPGPAIAISLAHSRLLGTRAYLTNTAETSYDLACLEVALPSRTWPTRSSTRPGGSCGNAPAISALTGGGH